MGRNQISISEDAQNLLDTLVEVFNSSRSKIIEELIIDYVDDYVNSRQEEMDAWIEEHAEDEDEESDEDEDEESDEDEDEESDEDEPEEFEEEA